MDYKNELRQTKRLLESYKGLKRTTSTMKDHELIDSQIEVLSNYEKSIKKIELAVNCLEDDETRKIIEYRYIKGFRYKDTLLHFSSVMSESTINRKINQGVIEVNRVLKSFLLESESTK